MSSNRPSYQPIHCRRIIAEAPHISGSLYVTGAAQALALQFTGNADLITSESTEFHLFRS